VEVYVDLTGSLIRRRRKYFIKITAAIENTNYFDLFVDDPIKDDMWPRGDRSKPLSNFVTRAAAKGVIFQQAGCFCDLTDNVIGDGPTGNAKIIGPDFGEVG
jgi:hypothetical protein